MSNGFDIDVRFANPEGVESVVSDIAADSAETTNIVVRSVNGKTGNVSLDQDDIPDGATAKQFTAAEQTKLAGIPAGATQNASDADLRDRTTHTGSQAIATVTGLEAALDDKQPLDADLTAIAGLTPSNDDVIQRKSGIWASRSMAQVKTDLALTKADVGLSNVDDTSDVNKPVSTAQQAALDLKSEEIASAVNSSGVANTIPIAAFGQITGMQIVIPANTPDFYIEGCAAAEITAAGAGTISLSIAETTSGTPVNKQSDGISGTFLAGTWSKFPTFAKALLRVDSAATDRVYALNAGIFRDSGSALAANVRNASANKSYLRAWTA